MKKRKTKIRNLLAALHMQRLGESLDTFQCLEYSLDEEHLSRLLILHYLVARRQVEGRHTKNIYIVRNLID